MRADSERLEELGLEGTFLELAPPGDTLARAAELCVRLQAEFGVAAVAGIAPTRFAAVLAAKHAGPGGIRRVEADEVEAFLGPFPVGEIWGLGPATARKLAEHGIHRIAELRALDAARLAELTGARAASFLEFARGADRGRLAPKPRTRTLSQEQTLDEPSVDLRALAEALEALAERIGSTLARERRRARSVTLVVSYLDGTRSLAHRDARRGHQRGARSVRCRPGAAGAHARGCARDSPAAARGRRARTRRAGRGRPPAAAFLTRVRQRARRRFSRSHAPSETGCERVRLDKDSTFDRRKYPRVHTESLVSIARVDAREALAHALDVSMGGIRFQCVGLEVELGEVLRVLLTIGDRTLSVIGKLVRVTELDGFTQEVALTFTEVDAETLRFLSQNLPEAYEV